MTEHSQQTSADGAASVDPPPADAPPRRSVGSVLGMLAVVVAATGGIVAYLVFAGVGDVAVVPEAGPAVGSPLVRVDRMRFRTDTMGSKPPWPLEIPQVSNLDETDALWAIAMTDARRALASGWTPNGQEESRDRSAATPLPPMPQGSRWTRESYRAELREEYARLAADEFRRDPGVDAAGPLPPELTAAADWLARLLTLPRSDLDTDVAAEATARRTRLGPLVNAFLAPRDKSEVDVRRPFVEAYTQLRKDSAHGVFQHALVMEAIYAFPRRGRPGANAVAESYLQALRNLTAGEPSPALLRRHAEWLRLSQSRLDTVDDDWLARRVSDGVMIDDLPRGGVARLLAAQHHDLASQARGTGFANEVARSMWTKYARHAELKTGYLLAGYHSDPIDHLTIAAIIEPSGRGDSVLPVDAWFARGLAVQSDDSRVYRTYARAVAPKWGGSREHLTSLIDRLLDLGDYSYRGPSWVIETALEELAGAADEDTADEDHRRRLAQHTAALTSVKFANSGDWGQQQLLDLFWKSHTAGNYADMLSLRNSGLLEGLNHHDRGWVEPLLQLLDQLPAEAYPRVTALERRTRGDDGLLTPTDVQRLRATVDALVTEFDLGESSPFVVNRRQTIDLYETAHRGEWVELPIGRSGETVTYRCDDVSIATEEGLTTVSLRGDAGGTSPRLAISFPLAGILEIEASLAPRSHPDGSHETPFGIAMGLHKLGNMAWVRSDRLLVGYERMPFSKNSDFSTSAPGTEFIRLRIDTSDAPVLHVNDQTYGPFRAGTRTAPPLTIGGLADWNGNQLVSIHTVRIRTRPEK